MNNTKKRFGIGMYFLLISLLCFSLVVILVAAQPVPHNVAGRVTTNSSNGVQNGIPVFINNSDSGTSVYTAVNAPPIPQLRGFYSATIDGNDGDNILVKAWNDTHYGENRSTLDPGTTFINLQLNITRDSEANVTIYEPSNFSTVNQSISFNVTANVTILGNDGVNCNATLSFANGSILNTTEEFNATRVLGNVNRGDHRDLNWTVVGIDIGTTNLSVAVVCESDGVRLFDLHNKTVSNITVQTLPPIVDSIVIANPIDLVAGLNTTFHCNVTVTDGNGFSDITVNATFFQESIGQDVPLDNNFHYTNSSCVNVSDSGTTAEYACGFPLAYYANNGTWVCNVTVQDSDNVIYNATETVVNELLAIDISPIVVDYGQIAVSQISADDVNVTVSNYGNMDFNISVHGYARTEADNISMACEKGNISIGAQRYAINPSTDYDIMINLTNETTTIPNMTFPQRTNDLVFGNDSNKTYWKMQIPTLVSGSCNGSLVFRTTLT